ncbi:C2H2 type zinc-finger-domain-containing protein, partial [Lineolata rhizophorae]
PAMASPQRSHPFTCNSCQVAFRSSELQRAHMQNDWHRYNLKRRVASLPPLSSEVFAEKVLATKASAAATAARAAYEKACAACHRTYYSENAFLNHVSSAKHRANVAATAQRTGRGAAAAAAADDDDVGSMAGSAFSSVPPDAASAAAAPDEDAEDEFADVVENLKDTKLDDEDPADPPLSAADPASTSASAVPAGEILTCLFCNYASPTFPLNIAHMERIHGMFIPERDFLVDEEGLIKHLYKKVGLAHECLWCGKVRHTAGGAQTHMRDQGHCMIAFDTEEEMVEIGQFYDFRATYEDAGPEQSDDESSADTVSTSRAAAGAKLGAPRQVSTATAGDAADDEGADDEGWETDSTLSSVPTDEITAVPIQDRSHRYKQLNRHRHHSHHDPRPHRHADGWHSHAHATPVAVYHDDYELHLPSGKSVGHRSLNRYWRQNLRGHPSAAEREELQQLQQQQQQQQQQDQQRRGRGRQQRRAPATRADGGTGMVGVTDAKRREVRAVEKRARQKEQRAQTRMQWAVEKKGNSQKHFRVSRGGIGPSSSCFCCSRPGAPRLAGAAACDAPRACDGCLGGRFVEPVCFFVRRC